ncbi:MAG TPA: lytic transglycosylase domain-containing protein [Patescibacteria group bacterium]|nr:lytic transglycosylase domain-containing protein [Patescibacteria group bacterium]
MKRGLAAALLLAFMGAAASTQAQEAHHKPKTTPHQSTHPKPRHTTVPAHKPATPAKPRVRGPQALAAMHDPLAAKINEWLAIRDNARSVPFAEIRGFLQENPDWPAREKLWEAAEKSMPANLADTEVLDWFRAHRVQTADGMMRYADSLQRAGLSDEAKAAFAIWWPRATIDAGQQAQLLSRFGHFIDRDTNIKRFNNLMAKGQYTNARPLAARIGGGYPQLAEARTLIAGHRAGADAALARVPQALQNDAGLLYDRLRARQRGGDIDGAVEILNRMPQGDALYNGDDWWKQSDIIARQLINDKEYARAYDVVSAHGLTGGANYADAEFQSGWLALRFLDRPQDALRHFQSLFQHAETPLSRSRGAYWSGRAAEVLGLQDTARESYQAAAFHQTTFYGRLAREKLAPADRPALRDGDAAGAHQRSEFEARDVVRAARLLANLDMDSEARMFIDAAALHAGSGGEFIMLADLAANLGYEPKAVQIAKNALVAGYIVPAHLYPAMENYTELRRNRALALSIIRQESVFDENAVSPAGARGQMQLMPATAKQMARKAGVPYSPARLNDGPYNRKLGSAFLEQLLDQYGFETAENKTAAAALAIAAYNAGPTNVGRWIALNGDPRNANVDLIDWIEAIPFAETRNYVQRVLEGEWDYEDAHPTPQTLVVQRASPSAPQPHF